MLAIIDYGVGNLFSLKSSLDAIGEKAIVTSDENEIGSADRLILPGVGAFADAAEKLRTTGMAEIVSREAASGKPMMGICLGMQLLFEESYEYGRHEGLGLIRGNVKSLEDDIPGEYKIPHIGWNRLTFKGEQNPLFKYIEEDEYVYFVHSYHAVGCTESTIAVTDYGIQVTAAVAYGNVYGCQFHPEKSGDTGLSILKAFCEVN